MWGTDIDLDDWENVVVQCDQCGTDFRGSDGIYFGFGGAIVHDTAESSSCLRCRDTQYSRKLDDELNNEILSESVGDKVTGKHVSKRATELHCRSPEKSRHTKPKALFMDHTSTFGSDTHYRSNTNFQFVLSWNEYEEISPRSDSGGTGLIGEWTKIMYRHFHEKYPTCPIIFYGNRIRRENSRKKSCRFWVGRARCKEADCIRVSFEIESRPIQHETIPVHFTVFGSCSHNNSTSKLLKKKVNVAETDESDNDLSDVRLPSGLLKRPLVGSERVAVGRTLTQSNQETTSAFYEVVGHMNDTELLAGNITACQSPQVLRQAKYERKLNERLAEDMMEEIRIQEKAWAAAFNETHIKGYVQSLGEKPFFLTFYLQEQVEMYINSASDRDRPLIVHYDATGSINRKVKDQSPPYYYCLIPHDADIPFLEFISTNHSNRWLTGVISTFLKDVKLCSPKKQLRPRIVVTDFSYAMMYSALLSFNDTTIVPYLNDTFNVLSQEEPRLPKNSLSVVVICEAHMIKALSMRLNRCERNAQKRKATLVIFSRLQRCNSLKEAAGIYRNASILLNSDTTSQETEAAKEALLSTTYTNDCDVDLLKTEVHHRTLTFLTKTSIIKKSPFTRYFNNSLTTDPKSEIQIDEAEETSNEFYCPSGFKCVKDVIHLFPFWSEAMYRLALQNTDYKHSPPAMSNAKVESYFRTLKKGTLRCRKRMRPREILCEQLKRVKGVLNAKKLPEAIKVGLKKKRGTSFLHEEEEKWKKGSRRRRKYCDVEFATAVLKKKNPSGHKSIAIDGDIEPTPTHSRDNNSSIQHHRSQGETAADMQFIDKNVNKKGRKNMKYGVSELSSDEIDEWLELLHEEYGATVAGLQATVLGQCVKGGSLPKFERNQTNRFVQICNVGDHWICVTNIFGQTPHDIFVYDSLYNVVHKSIVVQMSSLLRDDVSSDKIVFHLRSFKQQTIGTRLCGFYAAAAALDCCMNRDPTGYLYDETLLANNFRMCMISRKPNPFSSIKVDVEDEEVTYTEPKVHCLCHSRSHGDMVQCDKCFHWFHASCCGLSKRDISRIEKIEWFCPCCQLKEPLCTVVLD